MGDMTEEQLAKFFQKHGIRADINYYSVQKRNIYYAVIGEDHLPAVLFIHGAPASMTIYKNYFTDEALLKHFSLYAVDRPGYGVTDGQPEVSIRQQSEMIISLAKNIHRVHHPLLIVAGSYGASIACRMVMDHPGIVQGLVLISPSLGPGLEKMFWFTPLIHTSFLRKWVSKENYSATEERIVHERELKKMLPLWNRISIPVFYLQSKNDRIVYPSNAGFAKKHLVKCSLPDIHFFKGTAFYLFPASSADKK